MEEILKIENLKKIYGFGTSKFHALKTINLSVKKGEFVSIMGPSGAGKTTFLNIISGIDNATDGKVYINSKNIVGMDDKEICNIRREEMGIISQDDNLLESLDVKENLMLPLTLNNLGVEEVEKKIKEFSYKLGINSLLNKYPHEISGGQKQKVIACRAIIKNPKLILADEPTASLDSNNSKVFLALLQKINREFNTTIIMVTHDSLAATFTNRVVFIKDGMTFSELIKGDREEIFYDKITRTVAILGGFKNGEY